MKNKVFFSLICLFIVLFFGSTDFLVITSMFNNYQTDSDRIEFIQKNVDNNYKEILAAYNDIGSLEYVNEIYLSFDECTYDVTKDDIYVWENDKQSIFTITYGISDGNLYIKDVYNYVVQENLLTIFVLIFITFVGICLIYFSYKTFIKKV